MSDISFDPKTILESYRSAFAPALKAQQEGVKALDRVGRYQYAVAGDYLEWSLAQAKAAIGAQSPADFVSKQVELTTALSEKLRARAEEFVKLAADAQIWFQRSGERRRDQGRRRDQAEGELIAEATLRNGAPQGAPSRFRRLRPALTETGLLRIVSAVDQTFNNAGSSVDPIVRRAAEALARSLREQLAAVTGGLAPDVYVNAWWDWYLNIAKDPPKQLADPAGCGSPRRSTSGLSPCGPPPASRWRRTRRCAVQRRSLDAVAFQSLRPQHSSNYADWWQRPGPTSPASAPESARTLDFVARNGVETLSPANYLATNPELLNATRAEAGKNLVRGFGHWLEDIERTLEGKGPERHRKVRARTGRGRDPRQGRDAQRAGGIDSIFSGDPDGVSRSPC